MQDGRSDEDGQEGGEGGREARDGERVLERLGLCQRTWSTRSGRQGRTSERGVRTCRPHWFRTTFTSTPPRPSYPSLAPTTSSPSKIIPAHVPHTLLPPSPRFAARTNARNGSSNPSCAARRLIEEDSPPGMTSAVMPASSRAVLTGVTMMGNGKDREDRTCMCSIKAPCNALSSCQQSDGYKCRRMDSQDSNAKGQRFRAHL